MEIDITSFFSEADAFEFSRSRAEAGENAGPESWANAMSEAGERPLLTTAAELEALRDHARSFGAWDDEEIDAWTPEECNALLIQMVSGDMRGGGLDQCGADMDPDSPEWAAYREGADAGRYSGNIFVGDIPGHEGFGRVFYTLDR